MNVTLFPRTCEICEKGINEGFTNMEGEFVVCDKCFKEYMDKIFGIGLWRQTEDDGRDGFYEYCEPSNKSKYYGTGIFWTQW